jgi:hypothetical protein
VAELVGQQTDLKTSVGRDIYKTDKGELVSEKSVTFKIGDMFVNAPSIYEGKQYTEEEVRQMVLDGKVKPTSMHKTVEEAEKAAETRSNSLIESEVGYKEEQPMRQSQTSDLFGQNPELKYSTPQEIKENVGKNTTDADLKQIAMVGSELLVPGVSEAKDIVEIKNSIEKDDTLGAGIALSSLLLGAVPLVGGVARKAFKTATNKLKLKDVKNNKEKITDEIEESKEYINAKFVDKDKIPIKTIKGYKLFRQKDGELYPLFVDSKSPVPINRWLKATDSYNFTDLKGIKRTPAKTGDAQPIANQATVDEMKKLGIEPTVTKKALEQSEFGTVQSVKYRPGWHGDTKPMATHLKKGGDRVWAEVEFSDDIDYQTIANQGASKLKSGKIDSKTADLDYIPEGGSYRYKTNPNMEGSWLISGEMKVNKVLSENEVKNINKTKNFNEGGTTMKMKKQMSLFQEGGLEQDGGTVDPVSGNEVPVGSSQEEVRDDIDAKLSEGEFVFPADVVRYIGLEKLMQLRQEAKAGLKKMEAMGQMGNSEEATLPDDIPFSPEDIMVEDDDGNEGELEMQVGGVVPPNQQGVYYQPSQVGSQFNIAPQQGQAFQPMPIAPMPQQQTGYMPSFVGQPMPPQQQYTDFQTFVPELQDYVNQTYVNEETGETLIIPHLNGKPIYPPPAGFVLQAKEEKKEEEIIPETVPTAKVAEAKESDDRNENQNRLQSTKSLLGVTSTLDVGEGLKGLSSNKFGQAGLAYLAGGIPGAILALTGIPQKVANTILGKINSGQELTDEEQAQADALSNEIALSRREKYLESRPAATNLANQLGLTTVTGRVGLEIGDIDPVTGGIFNQAGQAVDPRTNENLTSYRSFKDAKVSMKAGTKAGWFGGEISNSTYMGLGEEGKKRYADYVKNMAEEGVNIASEGRQGSGTGSDKFKIATTQTPEGSQVVTKKTDTGESKIVEDKPQTIKEQDKDRPSGSKTVIQSDKYKDEVEKIERGAGLFMNKGGIASKPKKMKRGGLASK